MSELKAFEVTRKALFGRTCTEKVYLKSEADKVIADLEESHKMEVEQLLIEIAELKQKLKNSRNSRKYWMKEYVIEYDECRHQKYKRCLWTAMWCKSNSEIYNEFAADADDYMPSYEARFRRKAVLFQTWAMRWLELAEKFKEAK